MNILNVVCFLKHPGVEELGVDGKRNILLIMLSAVSLSGVTYEYKLYYMKRN